MKLVAIILILLGGIYAWATNSSSRLLTREYCLILSEKKSKRIRVSTLYLRDEESKRELYDECLKNNREKVALDMIRLLVTGQFDNQTREGSGLLE